AVPSGAAPHGARGEAVDDLDGHKGRQGNEGEDEQAVIGAAALSDRYNRQPRDRALPRHVRTNHKIRYRGQPIDNEARQNTRDQAQRAEEEHGSQRSSVGLVRALCSRRARTSKKAYAESLDKAGSGQGG